MSFGDTVEVILDTLYDAQKTVERRFHQNQALPKAERINFPILF